MGINSRDKERVKEVLSRQTGLYSKKRLKKSYDYLIEKLKTDVDTIREAVRELKDEEEGFVRKSTRSVSMPPKIAQRKSIGEYVIKNEPGTYYVTGCAHAPWHNKAMYNSVFNYLDREVDNLKGVILAGDIVDLNSLSSHDRGKMPLPGVTLEWEYREAGKFLDEIDSVFANVDHKVYLYGNHEDRYQRSLTDVNIAKYGEALKSPTEGLKLAERGYTVLEDWKKGHINLGHYLEINHGEFTNVHVAKKTIDTYRRSVMFFHTHRMQAYLEGLVGGWNMGWGGDINAPVFGYATRAMKTSWVNCSALVTIDNGGYYHVQPLMYINNKLIINGVSY